MEDISDFVASGLAKLRGEDIPPPCTEAGPTAEGHIFYGLARLYDNLARAVDESRAEGRDAGEVKIVRDFAKQVNASLAGQNVV